RRVLLQAPQIAAHSRVQVGGGDILGQGRLDDADRGIGAVVPAGGAPIVRAPVPVARAGRPAGPAVVGGPTGAPVAAPVVGIRTGAAARRRRATLAEPSTRVVGPAP